MGCEIDFIPVILRDLVELAPLPEGVTERPKRPKLGPRKSASYMDDFRHWADLCGAEVSPDAQQYRRSDTRLALRAALVAKDEGRFREYHYPMYRARWAEPADISAPDLVRQHLSLAGLDGETALERALSDEIENRLKQDTDDAIEKGVFGLPTIFVRDEMFWGNDRFELVRHYLQKEA